MNYNNDTPTHNPKKHSNLKSRFITAGICLPILSLMIYLKFLYFVLMLIVVFITHHEFHEMQIKILKNIFDDYYSDITWKILISSPLFTYICLLCPTILYFKSNSVFFGIMVYYYI